MNSTFYFRFKKSVTPNVIYGIGPANGLECAEFDGEEWSNKLVLGLCCFNIMSRAGEFEEDVLFYSKEDRDEALNIVIERLESCVETVR